MVTTSVGDREAAEALAQMLVEARLAACVQIMPIESVYRWRDAIETAAEFLLFAKIRAADFTAVEAAIRARHDYDLPEIIAVPIVRGSAAYLDWLIASTER